MNWKPAFNHEDSYLVSDTGLCKSIKRSILLRPRYMRGYVKYTLYKKGKPHYQQAHRLVYETFTGQIPDGLQINHLNGVKDDNRLENLEIVTFAENMAHRAKYLRPAGVRGSKNNLAKLTESQVLEIRELLSQGRSQAEVARMFNVTRTNICQINTRRIWFHI